ncbi:MAG: glycosyltransferase family 2 protein [Blautia sp.]|nr:glycosyltransferase family 2 protein [Candidatus Blautia excrementigallinarum]
MDNRTIDVIIPTYRPGKEFRLLLERLKQQSVPVRRVVIINTEKKFWDSRWEQEFPFTEVHHIKKEEFDHGGTRRKAAELTDAEIMVFMTQDALPADRDLIRNLTAPLKEPETAAAYARQLPNASCSFVERYTRSFNYPDKSSVKSREDLPVYGIKTFFCSNVCAAYRKDVYESLGGFTGHTIFNEDMIYASAVIQHGYRIAYAADAKVIHSHNYTCMQQFRRNFDLGVSQAEYPEVFQTASSESEGIRLVKKTFRYLCVNGRRRLIPGFVLQSGFKYAGYLAGKNYRRLPARMVRWCSMNKDYWRK